MAATSIQAAQRIALVGVTTSRACQSARTGRDLSVADSSKSESVKLSERGEPPKELDAPTGSTSDPDGELVARIADGDQDAARELVDRHLSRMVAVARRLLGKQEDAEEIAQEVFLKVWMNAGKWQPGQARFATWMHRVAVNLCYDRLRRKREIDMEDLPERADDAPDPSEALQSRQLADRVEDAMTQLPDRQRTAIVLCHHQGLTNIEAAQVMDVSIDALESLLARGRRGLKKLLSGEIEALIGDV